MKIAFLLSLLVGLAPTSGLAQEAAPPSRALLRELSRHPRLAGTVGSQVAARLTGRWLADAGFSVAFDEREVALSLPRRIEVALYENAEAEKPIFRRIEAFDARAIPPGEVPLFNAWAATGEVRAEVVDCGRGLRGDFERLRANNVTLAGKIALCRYGGAYRGVKVDLATEYGCVGALLFSESKTDGPERGAVWPEGPWKPEHTAQRGSISPMGRAPGDPSTPGFASPARGESAPAGERRLEAEQYAADLPSVPCSPIGSGEARAILEALEKGKQGATGLARFTGGANATQPLVHLALDQPRELFEIVNVVGAVEGREAGYALFGGHRDAWVRGANDAGSGIISLIRAAQLFGEHVRKNGAPRFGLKIALWDAEESGLLGSTEWGESLSDEEARNLRIYVNADVAVHGTQLKRLSGSPGLEPLVQRALQRVKSYSDDSKTLWEEWRAHGGKDGTLALPGSGSDFTVFAHHLGRPVLDFSLSGSDGGQYHTAFDDFEIVDRFIDPGFHGHELAAHALFELMVETTYEAEVVVDLKIAATRFAGLAREYEVDPALDSPHMERIATAFESLAQSNSRADFYRAMRSPRGLPGRPWFKNDLWAPGLETGYSAEIFPSFASAHQTEGWDLEGLEDFTSDLLQRIEIAAERLSSRTRTPQ